MAHKAQQLALPRLKIEKITKILDLKKKYTKITEFLKIYKKGKNMMVNTNFCFIYKINKFVIMYFFVTKFINL